MKYLKLHPKRRPRNINKKIKKELLQYVSNQVKEGHFPSRREIDRTFKIRLDSYFKNIDSLYDEVGVKYKLCANQHLKSVKANLLLELIINNLEKFNVKLILSRGIHERGIDILTKKDNKQVGIEIKAYNQGEKLKLKDIKQVERFIEKENLDEVIIITTTDKKDKNLKITNKISVIDYSKLIKVLKIKSNKDLLFIRNYSINNQNKKY